MPANERKNDTVVVRRSGRAYCPLCRQVVELLTYPGAAISCCTDLKDIDIRAQKGILHRLHNRSGEVMICSRSLREYLLRDTRLPIGVIPRN